ncbi:MAG: LiaF-related protein [Prevotellaceae bacterium]|jgi:predicted membrane protein|nr:LiaF-related protein [Prevotellaceae bacterium]
MKTFRTFTVRSLLIGVLLIAIGVILLMFNAGVLPPMCKPIIFSWQMLTCVVGFFCLFSPHKFFFGLFLIFTGAVFLLPEFNIEALSFLKDNIWAIVFIVIGLFVVFQPFWHGQHFNKWQSRADRIRNLSDEQRSKLFDRYRKMNHPKNGQKCNHLFRHYHNNKNAAWSSNASTSGYVEYNAVFGGRNAKIATKMFKGGEINCVFGGVELDFSEVQLAEGTHTLEINCVFGGAVLYFPLDWHIEVRQSQVFGNFTDKRPRPTFEVDEKKTLILEVTIIFGGGEIKLKG